MAVPAKVSARIGAGIKKFQPILEAAKSRDVNESDTVVIVADMLQEIFGYDKYSDITSEHAIRGTFCDLAIKIDGILSLLIEVKAIGLDLKDNFVKQAIDYAANQGCDWVVLTNGICWRIYKVTFAKPIDHELVLELNISTINHRSESQVELVWLLAKEGWQKARIGEYHSQRQALSRFSLAALISSDSVLDVLRRELRRISPGVKVETNEIKEVLLNEVLKRDAIEGEKADAARRLITRAANKAMRAKKNGEKDSAATTKPEAVAQAIGESLAAELPADEK